VSKEIIGTGWMCTADFLKEPTFFRANIFVSKKYVVCIIYAFYLSTFQPPPSRLKFRGLLFHVLVATRNKFYSSFCNSTGGTLISSSSEQDEQYGVLGVSGVPGAGSKDVYCHISGRFKPASSRITFPMSSKNRVGL